MIQVYLLLIIVGAIAVAAVYFKQRAAGATTVGSGGSALVSGVEGQLRMVGWAMDPVKTAQMFAKVARGATMVIAKGWRLLVAFLFTYAKQTPVISNFASASKYNRTAYAKPATIIEYAIEGERVKPQSFDPEWQPDLHEMSSFTICTPNGFIFTAAGVACMIERTMAWTLGVMFQLRPNVDDAGNDSQYDYGWARQNKYPAKRILHAMRALMAGCPNALAQCGLFVARVTGPSADAICAKFGVEPGAFVFVTLAPGLEDNDRAYNNCTEWCRYANVDHHDTNFTPNVEVIPGSTWCKGEFTVTAAPSLIDPAQFDAEVKSLEAMLS